jgi:hypothetical protein
VHANHLKTYLKDRDWGIHHGREGKPSIITTFRKGKEITRYRPFRDKGLEPFIFYKSFTHNGERYIDISEDFLNYFKLYERITDKQNRTYYFIDDGGDLHEVLKIVPNKVQVKHKYLMEYLTIRKVCLSICFDFMRLQNYSAITDPIKTKDEDFVSGKGNYNHCIRLVPGLDNMNFQSWITGKIVIPYEKKRRQPLHFEIDLTACEKFIIGYDEHGNEILESCGHESNNRMLITYFKKEVLDKYYNDPGKYEVDGFHVKSRFFILKIDNNIHEYVAVFLKDLASLPHKEQLHWKQYNIVQQKGLSHSYYRTMIEGRWAEHPETEDLFFKDKYQTFNQEWEKKFGWKLYKPLNPEDSHVFLSLHTPTTDNVKEFCTQVLALVKITIDSLNEKELSSTITIEKDDKGIRKLEKFLNVQGLTFPEMFEFLRNLQSLRSGLIAHRFSESNATTKKAMDYFKMGETGYKEVAKKIFLHSIYTLNTLEKYLLKQDGEAETV